jgi:EpsI family protein
MYKHLIVLLILTGTATTTLLIARAQNNVAQASSLPELLKIPSQILEFSQARPDAPVPASTRKSLETNTILMRDYASSNGRPVNLTIVFAEKTRRSLHFPEVCFTGQGWETHGKSSIPVGIQFLGQGLTVQKGDSKRAVLYWFKTGNELTGSYYLNTFYWSADKLLLRNPSTMLIRLSTPVDQQGEARAYQVLSDFASGLTPIIADTIP